MGFLQERAHNVTTTGATVNAENCHLFFGCRKSGDRIYGKLIDGWEDKGILRHHLALSREENMPKMYVQDKMRQMGSDLCELLLKDTACIYICGDAKVANGCFEACVEVLNKYGNLSRITAVMHIKKMRSQNRWQYDLWGSVSQFNEIKEKKRDSRRQTATMWLKSKP